MSEIIKVAGTKVGGLAEEMGNWKDKKKKWTVGGKEWTAKTAGKCRGLYGLDLTGNKKDFRRSLHKKPQIQRQLNKMAKKGNLSS